jgi:MFS family permease
VRAYLRSLDPRLPREVWILQGGGLANSFGNGIVLPFVIIYLHNVRGISLGVAGLIAAAGAATALLSGVVAGTLADRIGPRFVLAGALLVQSVSMSLFPLIHTAWHAFLLNCLLGLGSGAFWPSQSSLLTALSPSERRHAAFALQRVTMNLGVAVGGLIGGLIASTSHPTTFTVLFLGDACTFLVYAFVVLRLAAPPAHPDRATGRYRDVVRDRPFMSYVLLNTILMAAGMAVIVELLPPFAKNEANVSETGIGILWFVDSIIIVVAQLPVARIVEGRRRMRGLAAMAVLWAGALLGFGAAGYWFEAGAATLAMALITSVFAVGECLHGAIAAPLAADLAPPALLGRYMALSSLSWQTGWIIGPAVGGFLLQHAPYALWILAAGVCAAAAAWALALERVLPASVRLTPHVDSVAGVGGTMAKMAPATDDPLSTGAEPAPHPANAAATGGGRPAPARGARR